MTTGATTERYLQAERDSARADADRQRAELKMAQGLLGERAEEIATLRAELAGAQAQAAAAIRERDRLRAAFPGHDVSACMRMHHERDELVKACEASIADHDWLMKARGPSRFVSVEKVREAAMKVASNVWGQARGMRPTKPKTKAEVEAELTAIVDAQLAEVTT